jgi:transposase
MSVYVGIDVHRKRSQVAVVAGDGKVQLNRNVVDGQEPMLRLIGGLPAGTPVAFEAACGWGWLAGLLEDCGFDPHLVHPLRCKAIASVRLKNDKVDACIRCPLLRPGPAQRPRLAEIRDNLTARIGEAQREGRAGEAEGLQVTLAATRQKLAEMDEISARRRAVVHLGMPGRAPAVGPTVTTPAALPSPILPRNDSDQGKP